LVGAAEAGLGTNAALYGVKNSLSGSGGQSEVSIRRAKRPHERGIAEHEAKPEAYRDPDACDNKGFLRNASSEQIRQRIIETPIGHLQHEIDTHRTKVERPRALLGE
jgi:hypothetical protein